MQPGSRVYVAVRGSGTERAVVVGHDRRARRLRVVDGTRSRVALDFDPSVAGIASQPFWLYWTDEEGKLFRMRPTTLLAGRTVFRWSSTAGPVDRRKPRDAAKFDATARVRDGRVGVSPGRRPDPILTANLRWLAGYRHPRHGLPDVGEVLRRVFVDADTADGRHSSCGRSDRGAAGAVSRCADGRRIGAAALGHGGSLRGGWPMTLSTVGVLRPGDWVLYDGSEHQVLTLAGTSVRLRCRWRRLRGAGRSPHGLTRLRRGRQRTGALG